MRTNFEMSMHLQIASALVPEFSKSAQADLLATLKVFMENLLDWDVVLKQEIMQCENGMSWDERNGICWLLGPDEVQSQWEEVGWMNYPAMYQAQTQFLLAFYRFVILSGDADFAVKYWNSDIKRALDFLLRESGMKMEMEKNFFMPLTQTKDGNNWATGLPYSNQSSNWMDAIGFGGIVSINSAEAIQVINVYIDFVQWLLQEEAKATTPEQKARFNTTELSTWLTRLRRVHNMSAKMYNEKFWNEEQGMYCDWIDTSLVNRSCFGYLWQQALALDPLSGIVGDNATRAKLILDSIDTRIEQIAVEYNLTGVPDYFWFPPTNLYAVPLEHQVVAMDFGIYENGGGFATQYGWQMYARFASGDKHHQEKGVWYLDRFLDEYSRNRCWAQHYYRPFVQSEQPQSGWSGSDVLTSTLMILYSVFRGVFSVHGTLTNGIYEDRIFPIQDPSLFKDWTWSFFFSGEVWQAKMLANGSTTVRRESEINPNITTTAAPASSKKSYDWKETDIIIACCAVAIILIIVFAFAMYRKKRYGRNEEENEGEKNSLVNEQHNQTTSYTNQEDV